MVDQALAAAPPSTLSTSMIPKATTHSNNRDLSRSQRSLPTLTSNTQTNATAISTMTPPAAPPWMPNTTIMDMPNEVLREIFLSIDGEFSRTLWSISLTCRHLRSIVEEHCEPEYNLQGKWIEDPYPLMERIKEQPYLKRVLRVLRMEYNFMEFTKHTEEHVDALVNSLGLASHINAMYDINHMDLKGNNGGPVYLSLLLPSVETIELSTETTSTRTVMIPLIDILSDPHCNNVLQSHGFNRLRNLRLSYPKSTDGYRYTEDIYPSVFVLPNLRKANLFGGRFDCGGWGDRWPDPIAGISPVTELEIFDEQEFYMRPDNLEHWDTYKNLRVLRLHIEHTYLIHEAGYHAQQHYIQVLASQAHSLEHLQLYSNEQYCSSNGTFTKMSPYCPGQPSLKHFTKLRSLGLTDMSLVGVSTHGPTHWHQSMKDTLDHLADMFPSTLETFTHLVWDGPASFSKVLTKRQRALRSWKTIWKASDQEQFPSLRKVVVQKYGMDGLSEELGIIWERKE